MVGRNIPRRPPSGAQQRAEETRAAVIDETVRCVLEEGFAAPSVRHVTARAGVTWGVVKYHFGDHAGLLMAVADQGFGELIAALKSLPLPEGFDTRRRTEIVVERVWEAFSSPTSMAALEILIATRAMRDDMAASHLAEVMVRFTGLGRQLGAGLDAPQAGEVGNLIWTAVRGMVVAQMASTRQLDFSADRRMLVAVITAYLESHAPGGARQRNVRPRRRTPSVRVRG